MLRAIKAILRALANLPQVVMALVLVAGEMVWKAVRTCFRRPDETGDALEEQAAEVAAAKASDAVPEAEGDDPATEWGRGALALLDPADGPQPREVRFLDAVTRDYLRGLTDAQRVELVRWPAKRIGQHLLGYPIPTLPVPMTMEAYTASKPARLSAPLPSYAETLRENDRLMAEARAILEDPDAPEYRPLAA